MKSFATFAALTACLAVGAHAQNIERVKMTDNDLTCQQMYQEITLMDGVMARASQPLAPVAAAAGAPADSGAGAQVAGAVVQTAIAQRGFGGFGGFGGGVGGLLGGLAGQAQQAAAQQAAQQQAAQQQAQANAAAQASQNAMLSQQAQGRKEHLTGLFLGKGCKMSDIQK